MEFGNSIQPSVFICCSEFIAKGEHHIVYRNGRHIPPGGNYFCKTKFITSDEQMDCFMIAAAFADFRSYIPIFIPYSERPYYFSMFGYGNAVTDQKKLEERLKMDIEGVFLTAIHENIDILVLGASGCGAFCHDANLEAKLWSEIVDKYQSCFDHLAFAILPDKRRPENVKAFQKYFQM